MPYYRLYQFNGSSGPISLAEEIDAADDGEAVALVRKRERDTAVELWKEGRKVLRLAEPTDISARSEPEETQNAVPG